MAGAVDVIDDAIKEYLLFRGFTHSLRVFESDLKADRDKGFQVNKIVGQLFAYVHSSDLDGMLHFWDHLDRRFFSRLGAAFVSSVRKLELCLKRYYLVYAVQRNRLDKVNAFFEALTGELQGSPEWQDWFALAFVKNPETHLTYATYFSRQWLETFNFSLHNFLNTVFQNMALPTLLSFEDQNVRLRSLEEELRTLKRSAAYYEVPRYPRSPQEPDGKMSVEPPTPSLDTTTTSSSASEITPAPVKAETPTPTETAPQQERSETTARPRPTTPVTVTSSAAASPLQKSFNREPFIILDQDTYEEHHSEVVLCKVSIQGQFVASVDSNACINIWSFTPMKTQFSYQLVGTVLSLAWDCMSEHVVFCGNDKGTLFRIDVGSGTVTEHTFEEVYSKLLCIAMSPTGSSLICSLACQDGGGALLKICPKTFSQQAALKQKPKSLQMNCLCFNHNGTLFIAGASDGCLHIIDNSANAFIVDWQAHDGRVFDARFSHDEASLFTAGADSLLRKWDARGQLIQQWTSGTSVDTASRYPGLNALAFDVDDECLIRCFSPESKAALSEQATVFEFGKDGQLEPVLCLEGHSGIVSCSDWCQTTQTAFTGCAGGLVRVHRLFKVG